MVCALKYHPSLLLLLTPKQGQEGDAFHRDHLESDSRNITLRLTLLTKTGYQHFVVLVQVIKATVPRYESSDLLSILFQHDSHSFSNGGIRLFRLYSDLLYD